VNHQQAPVLQKCGHISSRTAVSSVRSVGPHRFCDPPVKEVGSGHLKFMGFGWNATTQVQAASSIAMSGCSAQRCSTNNSLCSPRRSGGRVCSRPLTVYSDTVQSEHASMFSGQMSHIPQASDISDILAVVRPDHATEVAISAGVLPKLLQADQTLPEQVHENDIAKAVIVCEPEGASLMMGALHPRASLFERCVSHSNFNGGLCTKARRVALDNNTSPLCVV
jgi:hypothetical protein